VPTLRLIGILLLVAVFPIAATVMFFSGLEPSRTVNYSLHATLALWATSFAAWTLLSVVRLAWRSGRDGLIGTGIFVTLCLIALPAVRELGAITNGG
jgi:hypothetical protein